MIALVVIKDNAIRDRIFQTLKENNISVIKVSNSINAVNVLRTSQVDLVITEVDIGDVDGWRLARFIRTGILTSHENLPIILVTDNYCERIAETTARMFDITRVISFSEIYLIAEVAQQAEAGINCLNELPRILVIEDTQDTANLVKRMLKNKFIVDLAEDGLIGIDKFKQNNYDLILLDIMMPGMSGDEVLDVLVELKPRQIIIAMTAHGNIDLAELMLTKGASDYIQKPFKAEQLRKVCDIAAKREDFLISQQQFSSNSLALANERQKYDSLSKNHIRILDSLNSIVIEISPVGRITFLNKAWQKHTNSMVSEAIGKQFIDFIAESSSYTKHYINESFAKLLSGEIVQDNIELKLSENNKESFWCEFNLSPHFDEQQKIIGISGTIDDISIRKKAEKRLRHVALHDSLTGIHNRYYFDSELRNIASTAKRANVEHSLLYLDLDHFKVINDSQGHKQGDLVLKEIARLLQERTRESDVLARIGGDEFAMLLTNTKTEDAKKAGIKICEIIANSSFRFAEQVYKVSCSIGVSAVNGQEQSSEIYLQQADIAMFAAKEKGRNRVHIFDQKDKTTDSLKQSFEWAQKLQQALFEDNIVLHFQPIINVKTGETECYEALVRLIVDGEMIFPNSFIPSLEKAEDMSLLDRHVIGKALSLMQKNPILKRVAINLSAQAFTDDRLFSFIAEKLTRYQIDPNMVIFELTESASLANITGTQRMVNGLNDIGCHFSIDDFGTGFSTFSYLKQIPAGSVKIDGSFVKDMVRDPIDAVLVKAINDTAHALGKTTVAEFVEDAETLDKLAELGVDYAQGYHISKPMSLDELIEKSKQTSAA
ncbi:MAG: EAL domain-containing protein [Colwellia sp.]|nr:EAL domain-containing protein [Colwellia sp.]